MAADQDGLEEFFAGYRQFRTEVWPERRKLFETLARDGQSYCSTPEN